METATFVSNVPFAQTTTTTTTAKITKAITRHAPTAARVVLGLAFSVIGLDGFLHFIPQPAGPFPEGAMAFGAAMMNTGYLWQLVKGTELLVGVLLLANRFVPLALTLLAPGVVNIIAFHLFLEPSGIPVPVILLALQVYLAWAYRAAFRPVLTARTTPAGR
ncbi:MAG TPA: DoxX family protein [Polyangiaceae bacterium]|nr:DoxX family protein [Polyangiaceae bacterium]